MSLKCNCATYMYLILPDNLVLYFTFVILSSLLFFFHILFLHVLSASLSEATYEPAGRY